MPYCDCPTFSAWSTFFCFLFVSSFALFLSVLQDFSLDLTTVSPQFSRDVALGF